jgi:hypothetical protein
MSNQNEAKRLLQTLEGTAISDLRACIKWSREYPVGEGSPYGGLNFTLCLLSLVVCETLGYYITGAQKHKEAIQRNQVDTGNYIMEFVQRFFHRDSYFKKLRKVLADFLRHALVHGFGSGSANVPFEIALFIDKDESNQIIASHENNKKTLKLNSVALAHQTIEAFDKLKRRVDGGTDMDLCNNIADASRYTHPVSHHVSNEFDAVYKQAQRKRIGIE